MSCFLPDPGGRLLGRAERPPFRRRGGLMKIIFSECAPNYAAYVFPYQVWAFLEDGEQAGVAYESGFLPGALDLSRFYLTRSVRVDLEKYTATGRVRYVERRCAGIDGELLDRRDFRWSPAWRSLADEYFDRQKVNADYRRKRFGEMLDSPFATHVLTFTDTRDGSPAGLVPVFVGHGLAQYGIPVYDARYRDRSIGNYMMSSALREFQSRGLRYCYLGSCYTAGDLYKTRFVGVEIFNGRAWSADRDELHFLLDHQDRLAGTHILEYRPYVDAFCDADVASLRSGAVGRFTAA
ncbi:GNAT family N-acetyltransferase [Nonomuraea sp. NPDC050783]|uniref:GNAT family N-acetyltransferase n=1 Tax=Nonomuraea sp. NPDC050783 TaxID=3154634 RepID=UPI0034666D24